MAHCAHIPAFVLHQVTCQFATGQTLFGPLSVSLEPSLCGLVGRNGVGKTRLLRLLAGLDSPAGGHIERAAAVAWVAQQPTLTPETTLATLLGYASVFAALSRLEQGQGLADDFDLLDGHWDLTDRLSLAFREADLPPFSADRPAFSLSGGERMKALLCGAFVSGADYLLLDEPTNHLDRQGREWLYHQLESWQGGALIASHDRELLTRMPRIIELTPMALRSYGGNYDEYQRQRMAEQQAARAALEHAVTDRRRTRARMHKPLHSSVCGIYGKPPADGNHRNSLGHYQCHCRTRSCPCPGCHVSSPCIQSEADSQSGKVECKKEVVAVLDNLK